MAVTKYIKPYVEHGEKAGAVRKITVSIPLHVLRLLSDERTRRQVNNLRHATNSDLLVEAFLHAFTGQDLPKDEDLKRVVATLKASSAHKKAASSSHKKAVSKKAQAVKKAPVKATVKKSVAASSAKKPASKKAEARKPVAARKATPAKKTAVAAKVSRVARTAKPKKK